MGQDRIFEEITPAVIRAGQKILEIRDAGFEVTKKADGSPVTIADQAAETIILEVLRRLSPDIPIVAEELFARNGGAEIGDAKKFFLVDALDGTKSFVSGGDGYTVNVALIENNHVVFGVVYAPVTDILYIGDVVQKKALKTTNASGHSAQVDKINTRKRPSEGAVIVSSIHHVDKETENLIAKFKNPEILPKSSSIKFCIIAEGLADVYPRYGSIMEWDTAAGHAVLSAAGGCVLAPDRTPFLYGKKGFRNTSFIAMGENNNNPFWGNDI
jgi:3'(2'),5'-bisphosphate nucleotidase